MNSPSQDDVVSDNKDSKSLDKSTKWLDKATKWVALYAAILTTILAVFTLVEKLTPKKHELEVFVSDSHSGSEFIDFTIAYYNSGDYSEVLSNVSLYLAQEVEGYKNPMYFEQASCRKPLLVESGKTVYNSYRVKLDYKNEELNLFSMQKQKFDIALHFDFLSKEYGRTSNRFYVAKVTPIGEKVNINFMTTREKIDFSKAKPVVVLSTYPIDKKYEKPSFCAEKI